MKRILYISAAAPELGDADIADILAASRRNNARADVSGMLLAVEGNFLQVLEGPEAQVDATFDRIAADARHRHLLQLWSEPADARIFDGWTMGFDRLRPGDAFWDGAFAIDPRRPDAALAPGAGPEIVALMGAFYETARIRRFA